MIVLARSALHGSYLGMRRQYPLKDKHPRRSRSPTDAL
jgi:hypothetical protein